jgi:predicted nucleic acid-binding protein
MKENLLFDTSVWIDFFNGIENQQVNLLTEYITNDYPVFICPAIIQEVLQGISLDKRFSEVGEALTALIILKVDPVFAAIGGADIYRKLRKKGITVRKSNDCLIAWYGINYSLRIVHKDRDFDTITENFS